MFSTPKIYTNIDKEMMNVPNENFQFSKDEMEKVTKTPEEIGFMLTREMFLESPTDVYWWFNNLSSRHQKIMMKGFVDCLNMDETHLNVWGNKNHKEDIIPMELDEVNNNNCDSSITLPSLVRNTTEPVRLLDTDKGHPNVTERNDMDIDDDRIKYNEENTRLFRQSSDGIYNNNEIMMDTESNDVIE